MTKNNEKKEKKKGEVKRRIIYLHNVSTQVVN